MKKLALVTFVLFAFAACNNPGSNSSEVADDQTNMETQVGGDQDDHGCLTAAGETWSELKQECIQVFEVAQRLNPVEVKEGEASFSAFALFNDDKSKVELFLPESESASVLNQTEEGIYENDTYKFDANEQALYVNGEKKFDGNL